MFNKLASYFPNSSLKKNKPDVLTSFFHWFSNEQNEWIGIPMEDISAQQLELLKTLFSYHRAAETNFTSMQAEIWYLYLYKNGPLPSFENNHNIRFTFFQLSTGKISILDFEAAIQAFFECKVTIIWENDQKGIIIEPQTSHSLLENEFFAMSEVLKSDFFVEPSIYIGKFHSLTNDLLNFFQLEKNLFDLAGPILKKNRVANFETLAPHFIGVNLPRPILEIIEKDIIPIFKEDSELFFTIKHFLQNNMNSSHTAKNLYIHRNTLQYRLDKFAEKTGISLKDFHSAVTVYIACIVFDIYKLK